MLSGRSKEKIGKKRVEQTCNICHPRILQNSSSLLLFVVSSSQILKSYNRRFTKNNLQPLRQCESIVLENLMHNGQFTHSDICIKLLRRTKNQLSLAKSKQFMTNLALELCHENSRNSVLHFINGVNILFEDIAAFKENFLAKIWDLGEKYCYRAKSITLQMR